MFLTVTPTNRNFALLVSVWHNQTLVQAPTLTPIRNRDCIAHCLSTVYLFDFWYTLTASIFHQNDDHSTNHHRIASLSKRLEPETTRPRSRPISISVRKWGTSGEGWASGKSRFGQLHLSMDVKHIFEKPSQYTDDSYPENPPTISIDEPC